MSSDANDQNEESPDWMAITLQYLLGALVGGGFVFYEFLRYGLGRGAGNIFLMICTMSGAIVLGSIAALFGDEIWGVSFRVIPNMPIRHSRSSRLLFTITMVLSAMTPLIYWVMIQKT
jgi:hypothetical protein